MGHGLAGHLDHAPHADVLVLVAAVVPGRAVAGMSVVLMLLPLGAREEADVRVRVRPSAMASSAALTTGSIWVPAGWMPVKATPSAIRWTRTMVSRKRRSATSAASGEPADLQWFVEDVAHLGLVVGGDLSPGRS